jgi:Flp pilus assembly protein TadG
MNVFAGRLRAIRRSARSLCRFGRDRAGTSALEFGLLLPVFLLLFLGIIEFGRALWTQSALQNAVEAAARYAAINYPTCASVSQTKSYAAGEVFGQSIPSSTFSLSCNACGTQVSASLPFSFIVPGLIPYSITLGAQSCHPV